LYQIPNLGLAQLKFLLTQQPDNNQQQQQALKAQLLEGIQSDRRLSSSVLRNITHDLHCFYIKEMAPYYEHLVTELKWKKDESLLKSLKAANEAELKKLQDKLQDAETNLGETEICDALLAKAQYLARTGDKVCSLMGPTTRLPLTEIK
jgi:26S proteasome regulatory subunit N7